MSEMGEEDEARQGVSRSLIWVYYNGGDGEETQQIAVRGTFI